MADKANQEAARIRAEKEEVDGAWDSNVGADDIVGFKGVNGVEIFDPEKHFL